MRLCSLFAISFLRIALLNKHLRVYLFFFLAIFCLLVCHNVNAQTPVPSPQASPSKQIFQLRVVGQSLKKRPITAHVFGDGAKKVLMLGGIHGDETSAADLARLMTLSYKSKPAPETLTLMIIPEANPDGVAAKTRFNSRGVDINRNFPAKSWRPEYEQPRYYPGLKPASEPETLAMMNLIEDFRPHLIITFHAPLNCVNWDGPAERYATKLSELNHYPLCSSLGYETPGSLGQFAGKDRQIPVLTFELSQAGVTPETMNSILPVRQLLESFASGDFEEKTVNKDK